MLTCFSSPGPIAEDQQCCRSKTDGIHGGMGLLWSILSHSWWRNHNLCGAPRSPLHFLTWASSCTSAILMWTVPRLRCPHMRSGGGSLQAVRRFHHRQRTSKKFHRRRADVSNEKWAMAERIGVAQVRTKQSTCTDPSIWCLPACLCHQVCALVCTYLGLCPKGNTSKGLE